MYRWQEKKYHISRVENIKRLYAQKRYFFKTKIGQKFLKYKLTKFKQLHGLEVWLIDGNALRSGTRAGDVDFTMGGHAYRYLYIPRYEIWIDQLYKRQKDFWPLFWHEYIERSLMMKGKSYNASHNIASILEVVLRDEKCFVLPVGTVRQAEWWYCGPASLKIVLDFFRYPVSQRHLRRLLQTRIKKGTDPADIVRAAKKLNFKVKNRQYLTVHEVKKIIRGGYPIIANFQAGPDIPEEGHYAVIIGFTKEEFILSDPQLSAGYATVKIKDFMRTWYEWEDKTVRQGIILQAP